MRNTDISQLREQAEWWSMSYMPFTFPLVLGEDKSVPTFGTYGPMTFSRDGLNYLMYRLKGYVTNYAMRSLYYYPTFKTKAGLTREDFVDYVNAAREIQESEQLWRKNETLYAAYNQQPQQRPMIWGIMTNYNPKSNLEVLHDIEDAGLMNDLTWWTFKPKEMNAYFAYKQTDGFEYGLNVRNGETGHVTLGYHLYVANDDYVFSVPTGGKRRHLSKLHLLEDTMQIVYEELGDVKYIEYLQTTQAEAYAALLLVDDTFKKLHEGVEPFDSVFKPLYDLIRFLHRQRCEKGFKTICTKALDTLNKEIMEHV